MLQRIEQTFRHVTMWEQNLRSNVNCSLFNLVTDCNDSVELDIRFVYDEDFNEMNVRRIFINKKDEYKIYIEYYYLENGEKVSELITESILDFPTSTVTKIISMWRSNLIKSNK